MLPSIVTLLALPSAFAAENPTELANEIQAACQNATAAEVVIGLPAQMVLAPDQVVVYPDPDAGCVANPPDLVFQPNTPSIGLSLVRLQGQPGDGAFTLFTFLDGVNVTFNNVSMRGPEVGDPGAERPPGEVLEAPEQFTPECSNYGGQVRGILFDSSGVGSNRGVLSVNGGTFQCLDAVSDGTYLGWGGAIYSLGGHVVIENAEFRFNSAQGEGGAIAVAGDVGTAGQGGVGLDVFNATFDANDAGLGGAISVDWRDMRTRIDFSKFQLNIGNNGAGGINLERQREVTVTRSEFDRQNPTNTGFTQQGGTLRVDSRDLYNPLTPPAPADRGTLVFRNNIVCGSWAGRGGGLYVNTMPNVEIEGNVFAENGGIDMGGGLFLANDRPVDPEYLVLHNTFVGNEAGREPPFVTPRAIYGYGSGGAATFFGVNPEFRNNIVAQSTFGGGIFQEYSPFSTDGFQIGDPIHYYHNLFYENTDSSGIVHLTGDVATTPLHPSNIVNSDPQLAYFRGGEFNCVPDAFYTQPSSPAVNGGGGPLLANSVVPGPCEDWADESIPPDFQTDAPLAGDPACDIGAFGGENGLWVKDSDLDGFSNIFDCNDLDPDINPGATEICDFQDNNCNGLVDEDLESVWYPDADADGFGRQNVQGILSCDSVTGHVASSDPTTPINTDCNDNDPATFPGAPEVCNGVDNDCDGIPDSGLDFRQYFFDQDGDGFGGAQAQGVYCEAPFPGMVTQGGDCDDENPNVNPAAIELCGNGVDDNCNDAIDALDPSANANEYFVDADADGDGSAAAAPVRSCDNSPPSGFSVTNLDCNDGDPDINGTGALELCTQVGIDEDCDGQIDEVDAGTADASIFYADSDGDGFGNGASFIYQCGGDAPPGYVNNALDCNDQDNTVGDCSSGSCSSVASPTSAWGALVGLVLVGMGRRRRT